MRRTVQIVVAAAAAAALGAAPAAAVDDGHPMLDIAHSTAGGLNLWEMSLAAEDPEFGVPHLVESLTTGGFDYSASRTASGDFGNVSGSDDGTPDWLVPHRQPNGGVLLWVVGGGADTTPRLWADLRTGGWSWADSRQLVADLDGDGLDDVVSVHRHVAGWGATGANIWVHRNTGAGFADPVMWTSIWPSDHATKPFTDIRYLVGDATGDGRADLVTVERSPQGVRYRVFRSHGAGFDASSGVIGPREQGWSFADSRDLLADLDADGAEDLVTVHAQPGGGLLVWARAGGSGFELDETPFLLSDLRGGGWDFAHSRQSAADVDGDGADDLVSLHHQPGGGILAWAHRTGEAGLEAPVLFSDLRDGGWQYWSSRETVGFAR